MKYYFIDKFLSQMSVSSMIEASSAHLLTWCCCCGSCLINCVVCWCCGCCGRYKWACVRLGLASPSLSPTVTQLMIFLRCVRCDDELLCVVTCPPTCCWLLACVDCCIGCITRGVDWVLQNQEEETSLF